MSKTTFTQPTTTQATPSWQDHFKASSLRTSFNLSLTRPMLEFLCAVAEDVQWDRSTHGHTLSRPDNWMASSTSLKKRGLIERKPQEEIEAHSKLRMQGLSITDDRYEYSFYRLTPAGKLVVDLVKLTGLFIEADAAISKKARRA